MPDFLPQLQPVEWFAVAGCALCVGLAKAGLGGLGLVAVIVFARVFDPMGSTGMLLPLLMTGDLCAIIGYHTHAKWGRIVELLPPTIVGIVFGFLVMGSIPTGWYGPLLGCLLLVLVLLQIFRQRLRIGVEAVGYSRPLAWTAGFVAGVTTMLANAAGPVMTLYFLARRLPKFELVGTAAWLFLILNVIKVPFSAAQGLIPLAAIGLCVALFPITLGGFLCGRLVVKHIPQALFERVLQLFVIIGAIRMIWK